MALTSDNISIGSGELFCVKLAGTETLDETFFLGIESENNRLSHIKNGATLSYSATYYDAKDDLNMVAKTIATEEDVTFKSGLMTWNPSTLAKLCTTAVDRSTSGATPTESVEIGGLQNYSDAKYAFLFKHVDGIHYLYFVGQSKTSFDLAFQPGQETVIDAEFSCQPELTNTDGKKFCVRYFKH